MLECPTCKAQCFSQSDLNTHEVLSHLAVEVRTIESYTVIKFAKEEHAEKYVGDGKIEWEGCGWYVLDCDCAKNYACLLPLDHFVKLNEAKAMDTITKMTCVRTRMAQ
jgi:hypothetical protein